MKPVSGIIRRANYRHQSPRQSAAVKGWIISVFIHALIIGALVAHVSRRTHTYSHPQHKPSKVNNNHSKPIVHAKAVSESQVQQAVAHIKKRQQQKAQHQQRMKREAQRAMRQLRQTKHQRKRMEQVLAAKKRALKQLKQQQHKQHRNLVQAKKLRQKHQRQLRQLRQANQQAQKQLQQLRHQVKQTESVKGEQAKKLAALRKRLQVKKRQAEIQDLKKKISEEQSSKKHQAYINREVDRYRARIIQSISEEWMLPSDVSKQIMTRLFVRLAPDGRVMEVKIIRGSGDPRMDRTAKAAVQRASPLPVPQDTELFNHFRKLYLTLRPEAIKQAGSA